MFRKMRNWSLTMTVACGFGLAAGTPAMGDIVYAKNTAKGTIKFWKKGKNWTDPPTHTITVNQPLPIDNVYGPYVDKGLNTVTQVHLKAPMNYTGAIDKAYRVKGGDKLALEDPELFELITPVAEESLGTMDLNVSTIGSQLTVSGTIFNSDDGVVQRISWFDITSLDAPELLGEHTFVGGGTFPFGLMLDAPGGLLDNLSFKFDAAITTIPEPASLALLAVGALFAVRRARL